MKGTPELALDRLEGRGGKALPSSGLGGLNGYSIEVPIVPRDKPTNAFSLADFEIRQVFDGGGSAANCYRAIIATAVDAYVYNSGSDSEPWKAVLYGGDIVFGGAVSLNKDPDRTQGLHRHLVEELWVAIVLRIRGTIGFGHKEIVSGVPVPSRGGGRLLGEDRCRHDEP